MGRRPAPCGTETRYHRYKCRCDACVAAHEAWYAVNGPAARERVRAWRLANPDKAKKLKDEYRERHRERLRADALARYYRLMAEDPERVRAQRREWVKTPKGALANRLARHRRRGVVSSPEAQEFIELLLTRPCAYCGGPATEIDHIVPIAAGGTGDIENLAPACRSCNAKKGSKPLDQFLAEAS